MIRFVVKHAALVIIATFAATVVLGWFALKVRIYPDFASLLPKNAEVNKILKEYGGSTASTDMVVLAVTADPSGGDVFASARLSAFSDAVSAIAAIPGVQSVISPFNLVAFAREGGRLVIRPMSAGGTAPAANAVPDYRARLLSARYATNLVVSADATMLIAYFPMARGVAPQDMMRAVDPIAAGLRDRGLVPYITGTVPANSQTGFYLTRDLTRLLGLAAFIIVLCYVAGFRRVRGVVFPLVSVVFGTIWMAGFMGIMGFSLSLISVVAPPLIMIFGNEYTIYATSELMRIPRREGSAPGWIERASRNVAKPLTMAFLSTVVGFLSLCVTDIRQTREFAITASFGSLACAFLALYFLPALHSFLRPLPQRSVSHKGFDARMKWLARFSFRFPAVVLAVLGAVVILFAVTWRLLVFNTDSASYYPQNDRVLLDTYSIYAKAGGYDTISVSFDAPAGANGYFLDAAALGRVEAAERALRALPDISYSLSLPDLLRSLNIAATGRDELPTNKAIVTMFSRLLVAAGGTSASGAILGNLTNRDFTRLTISFRVYNSATGHYMDEARFRSILASIQRILADNPTGATPVIWGDMIRILSFADSLRRSLFVSMAISVVSILALTMFVFRSFLYGLYPLIPLAAGLLLNFSLMAILGIPLDMTTIMVSNIAIGVGVDSAIYLVIQYRRELARFPQDPSAALQRTLEIMGRPVLLSGLSIVAGLLVFVTASFRPVLYFGLLVMFTLLATTGGTLVTLPTLLGIDARVRLARGRVRERAHASP
jgi:predicted RND superfamily exporter protein